uniref:Galectin n=1 Tax=Panagrolaimus davidi TaxID=227884 RepID=A0A914QS80_9BILA
MTHELNVDSTYIRLVRPNDRFSITLTANYQKNIAFRIRADNQMVFVGCKGGMFRKPGENVTVNFFVQSEFDTFKISVDYTEVETAANENPFFGELQPRQELVKIIKIEVHSVDNDN